MCGLIERLRALFRRKPVEAECSGCKAAKERSGLIGFARCVVCGSEWRTLPPATITDIATARDLARRSLEAGKVPRPHAWPSPPPRQPFVDDTPLFGPITAAVNELTEASTLRELAQDTFTGGGGDFGGGGASGSWDSSSDGGSSSTDSGSSGSSD